MSQFTQTQRSSAASKRALFAVVLPPLLVFGTGVAAAALLYTRFLGSSRSLWNSVLHDRNAHLYSGLCLATDVRYGYWRHLFADLDAFRSWPPLHDGLFAGLSLWAGHGNERWAVLPSLAGWVGSIVLAFLTARRASPSGGTIAGIAAAVFVLVSPAQRAFATDVMLESTGACLTLACVYWYIAAAQEQTRFNARALALALTLLFFLKYNYWLLAVLGLGADALCVRRVTLMDWLSTLPDPARTAKMLARRLLHPVSCLFIALAAFILFIEYGHLTKAVIFGQTVSFRPTANLVTIAYIVLLCRLVPWYRRVGRLLMRGADPRIQALMAWHILPIAIWFLWPSRLYSFLWVLSPASNEGAFPQHNLLAGFRYYWNAIALDYHVDVWSALVAIALCIIAGRAGAQSRLRPGATAIFSTVAIAFLLTAAHPNRQSRFLHSWISLVWVGAGLGAVVAIPEPWRRKRGLNGSGAAAAAGALVLWQLSGVSAPAHAPEGGPHPSEPCALDITDAYLPDLADARAAAVFSNLPIKFLTQWTYMQRFHRFRRLETDIKGFAARAANNQACFDHWIAATGCDTIVYIDFRPESPFYLPVPDAGNLWQYGAMLQSQTRFDVASRRLFPKAGCTVTVWKRRLPAAHREHAGLER